jgi:SPFH domain/Band 7 family protein
MKAYIWPVEGRPPPTTARDRWRRFVERHLPSVVLYMMVVSLLVVVLVPHMVVTVPSGEVGVLWKRFAGGTVLDPRELRDEGLHVIFPWDRLFLYDLRVQSITETYNAISSDGVNLNATLNIRFRLQHDSVPTLHQVVGPNYIKLLGPEVASQMREVTAQYTAEQVYSTARQEIQDKIRELALERLSHKTGRPTTWRCVTRSSSTIPCFTVSSCRRSWCTRSTARPSNTTLQRNTSSVSSVNAGNRSARK